MRRRAITGALLLIVLGVALGATVFRTDIAQATGLAQSVTIDNTSANPVPVREQGTVIVQPTHQPFQQFVSVSSNDGGEHCDSVDVPAGKRLEFQSLSVDADGDAKPVVYMLVTARVGGGANFVRSVPVDLQPVQSSWAGVANLLLHTGAAAPGPHTFELAVCVVPGLGSFALLRGFVSGWIENT